MNRPAAYRKGMKSHYQNLLAYNSWANNLFLECLADNTVANARVYLLMSHLLTAEEIWLCRLQGLPAPHENLWQEYELPILKEKSQRSTKAWTTWLLNCQESDFFSNISYRNTKGEAFSTSVADILNHVINHGTYHRAQIATLLSLEAVDPPQSDYIIYARQK